MFKAISWSQYGFAVLLLLLVYYAYVLAVYYRQEVGAFFKGQIRGADRQLSNPDRGGAVVSASVARNSPLITPSLIVAAAVQQAAAAEPAGDEDAELSPPVVLETALPTDEGSIQQQPSVKEPTHQEEELGVDQEPELAAPPSLIEVTQLSEFLDKVEAGEFSEENAVEVPAALENTALLQDIFAAGLARRRASLAVLDDL